MKFCATIGATLVTVALAATTPALAIDEGVPDRAGHPYVGLLAADADGAYRDSVRDREPLKRALGLSRGQRATSSRASLCATGSTRADPRLALASASKRKQLAALRIPASARRRKVRGQSSVDPLHRRGMQLRARRFHGVPARRTLPRRANADNGRWPCHSGAQHRPHAGGGSGVGRCSRAAGGPARPAALRWSGGRR